MMGELWEGIRHDLLAWGAILGVVLAIAALAYLVSLFT